MLEQVSGLLVDLEGLGVIERFQVERFAHKSSVLRTTTRATAAFGWAFLSVRCAWNQRHATAV
jgi:hypothetical protein